MHRIFFSDGLRFECQQCGACCSGDPGTVYVAPSEVRPVAAFLGIPVRRLLQEHLYPYADGYSISETADGRCLFYEGGCRIYPVRPNQCRSFPFWFKNLRSEAAWLEVAEACPGIGRGPRYSAQAVIECLRQSVI